MRIAHLSDIHFSRISLNPFRWTPKRVAGMINWFGIRRKECDHTILNSLPSLFRSLSVDQVFFTGDISSTSLESEFEQGQKFFEQIRIPKLMIPGNHDRYTWHSHRNKRFYRFFSNPNAPLTHPTQFFRLSEHGIEVHSLMPGWWCIALDTTLPTPLCSSSGYFSQLLENYLHEVLQNLPKNDRVIVLNHFPLFETDIPAHLLRRAKELSTALKKHDNVCLYLHGHSHRHVIADLRPNHLPILVDAGCPIKKHLPTWNLIDFDDAGCRIQAYTFMSDSWQPLLEEKFVWKTK